MLKLDSRLVPHSSCKARQVAELLRGSTVSTKAGTALATQLPAKPRFLLGFSALKGRALRSAAGAEDRWLGHGSIPADPLGPRVFFFLQTT